jgi:hypothetical protein
LTLSIHHGLSVVADPIPSYQSYAEFGLATWEQNLRPFCLDDVNRRNSDLRCQIVRARNGVTTIADHWDRLFASNSRRNLLLKIPI